MNATTQPTFPAQPITAKLFYIDHIRIILTVLVVLHHACVAYGASGGWYYKESTANMGALIPMTMFVSLNQSFFMGFFFLLAALFTYSSYHRKGGSRFIKDRLLRLGIPLIFYSFVLSPFLSYLVYSVGKGNYISYFSYLNGYTGWIDFGVLWFVAALLLFTLIYVFVCPALRTHTQYLHPVPGTATILMTAVVVGLISFLVRIIFPVGWVLKPLGFQLGHFPQYITLFITGLLAAKNNWLEQLSLRTGKRMFSIALALLLFFPVFYLIRTRLHMPLEWYSGGFHWLSLLYSVWEQCIGFAIVTAFLAIGKARLNVTSPIRIKLSRCAFAVYIFHPLALIGLSLLVRNWSVDPALKLLVVAPAGVLASFTLGLMIVMLPGVRKII